MRKNTKFVNMRISEDDHRRIKAFADAKGVSVSSFMKNIVLNYMDKEIDVTQQMMASTSRLHNDLRQVRSQITLTYNLLYSYIYTFFVGFGRECMNEFATEELTKDKNILSQGMAHRKVADRMMRFFNEKFLSNEAVRNGMLQNFAEMLNPEMQEHDSEYKEDKEQP